MVIEVEARKILVVVVSVVLIEKTFNKSYLPVKAFKITVTSNFRFAVDK